MIFLNGQRFVDWQVCLVSHHSLLYFVADGNLSISQQNNHGPLQIISEYYRLSYPARGSSLTFHPLEHLHPLQYQRSAESVLRLAGPTVALKTFSTGLELVDVCYHHNFLLEESASIALQIWCFRTMGSILFHTHIYDRYSTSLLFVNLRHILLSW